MSGPISPPSILQGSEGNGDDEGLIEKHEENQNLVDAFEKRNTRSKSDIASTRMGL